MMRYIVQDQDVVGQSNSTGLYVLLLDYIKRTKSQDFFLHGYYFYRCLACLDEGKNDTEGGGGRSPPPFASLPTSSKIEPIELSSD